MIQKQNSSINDSLRELIEKVEHINEEHYKLQRQVANISSSVDQTEFISPEDLVLTIKGAESNTKEEILDQVCKGRTKKFISQKMEKTVSKNNYYN